MSFSVYSVFFPFHFVVLELNSQTIKKLIIALKLLLISKDEVQQTIKRTTTRNEHIKREKHRLSVFSSFFRFYLITSSSIILAGHLAGQQKSLPIFSLQFSVFTLNWKYALQFFPSSGQDDGTISSCTFHIVYNNV